MSCAGPLEVPVLGGLDRAPGAHWPPGASLRAPSTLALRLGRQVRVDELQRELRGDPTEV
jgi:hypothetical protein